MTPGFRRRLFPPNALAGGQWCACRIRPPKARPPDPAFPATPASTLLRARDLAMAAGLSFVYLGNLPLVEGRDTHCPACGGLCVERKAWGESRVVLRSGSCPDCGAAVAGHWPD